MDKRLNQRPVRVAVNGFGRIGRTIARQILSPSCKGRFELVHINDIAPLDMCSYLFRFDSVFGPFQGSVEQQAGALIVDGYKIHFTEFRDVSMVDLSGVDVVLECTGAVTSREIAERGLVANAKNVLVSGPANCVDKTIVLGANEVELGAAKLVSNASCTTNAIAPLLRVLDDEFGIERGHVSTIHCYTNSQPLIDAPRETQARSRGAAVSMIPTTTSATRLVTDVLPKLEGKLTGSAVRVPVASVSAVEGVFQLSGSKLNEINQFLRAVCVSSPVLATTNEALVSSDLRGRPESLIIALPETMTLDDGQVRLFGWYDNEWGFSARMLDMAQMMAAR